MRKPCKTHIANLQCCPKCDYASPYHDEEVANIFRCVECGATFHRCLHDTIDDYNECTCGLQEEDFVAYAEEIDDCEECRAFAVPVERGV